MGKQTKKRIGAILFMGGIILAIVAGSLFAISTFSDRESAENNSIEDLESREEALSAVKYLWIALGSLFCLVPIGAASFVWGYASRKL